MTIEMPPLERPKVDTQLGQDANNIVMSIVIPYEVTGDLDQKKGLILSNTFVELQKISNTLNTTFGLDEKTILEKIFGK